MKKVGEGAGCNANPKSCLMEAQLVSLGVLFGLFTTRFSDQAPCGTFSGAPLSGRCNTTAVLLPRPLGNLRTYIPRRDLRLFKRFLSREVALAVAGVFSRAVLYGNLKLGYSPELAPGLFALLAMDRPSTDSGAGNSRVRLACAKDSSSRVPSVRSRLSQWYRNRPCLLRTDSDFACGYSRFQRR